MMSNVRGFRMALPERETMHTPIKDQTFVCIKNEGFEADLDTDTVYLAMPDEEGARHGRIRILDESGEDYLYPQDYFVHVEVSPVVREALMSA
jgi:hypothetical protein